MPRYPDCEPDFERWLALARRGDSAALGRVFGHFREELLRVAAQKLTGELATKADPADLVQETFVEAQIGFLRFLGLTESATFHWLKQILKNNIADLNRRFHTNKRSISNEQAIHSSGLNGIADEHPTPGTAAANRELSGHVLIAMRYLSAEYQEVLHLRESEDLQFAKIAQRMGRPSADAARKLFDRAFRTLQDLLEKKAGLAKS